MDLYGINVKKNEIFIYLQLYLKYFIKLFVIHNINVKNKNVKIDYFNISYNVWFIR